MKENKQEVSLLIKQLTKLQINSSYGICLNEENKLLKMKIDELNKQNIELFNEYNITKREEKIYKCYICMKSTSLNNSTSIRGAYLVCNRCTYNEFGNWSATRKWQNEMLKHFG